MVNFVVGVGGGWDGDYWGGFGCDVGQVVFDKGKGFQWVFVGVVDGYVFGQVDGGIVVNSYDVIVVMFVE